MTPMLVALIVIAGAHAVPASSPTPRIRPADPAAERLLADGARRSPTVAALVERVERGNAFFYVSTTATLRVRGVLTFMAASGPAAYFRIRIDLRQPLRDRLAVLAHELTHAAEIAEAGVRIGSDADLRALYRRIGHATGAKGEFESAAARANEIRAGREAADVRAAASPPWAEPCGVNAAWPCGRALSTGGPPGTRRRGDGN